jgi:ketosteroid isomerase-like protein
VDDHAEIEAANARFYRAFEDLDLAEMERVWGHGDDVACVHPGWPLLTGWEAVRASWHTIIGNTAEIRFTLGDVRVTAGGDLAWVTCTENILSQVHGQVAVTSVLATNIFERTPGGWRLVHHHASHILGGPPSDT